MFENGATVTVVSNRLGTKYWTGRVRTTARIGGQDVLVVDHLSKRGGPLESFDSKLYFTDEVKTQA